MTGRYTPGEIIGYDKHGRAIRLIAGGAPTDDKGRLLVLDEVSTMTRIPPASLRWLRHMGRAPWLWKSGRRLVAWESDVRKFLDDQQVATSK